MGVCFLFSIIQIIIHLGTFKNPTHLLLNSFIDRKFTQILLAKAKSPRPVSSLKKTRGNSEESSPASGLPGCRQNSVLAVVGLKSRMGLAVGLWFAQLLGATPHSLVPRCLPFQSQQHASSASSCLSCVTFAINRRHFSMFMSSCI